MISKITQTEMKHRGSTGVVVVIIIVFVVTALIAFALVWFDGNAEQLGENQNESTQTAQDQLDQIGIWASKPIVKYVAENKTLPDDATGNKLLGNLKDPPAGTDPALEVKLDPAYARQTDDVFMITFPGNANGKKMEFPFTKDGELLLTLPGTEQLDEVPNVTNPLEQEGSNGVDK